MAGELQKLMAQRQALREVCVLPPEMEDMIDGVIEEYQAGDHVCDGHLLDALTARSQWPQRYPWPWDWYTKDPVSAALFHIHWWLRKERNEHDTKDKVRRLLLWSRPGDSGLLGSEINLVKLWKCAAVAWSQLRHCGIRADTLDAVIAAFLLYLLDWNRGDLERIAEDATADCTRYKVGHLLVQAFPGTLEKVPPQLLDPQLRAPLVARIPAARRLFNRNPTTTNKRRHR